MDHLNEDGGFSGIFNGGRLEDADALLFDLDGVLARSPLVEVIVRTAALFGVRVEPIEVTRLKLNGRLTCGWSAAHEIISSSHPSVSFEEVQRRFEFLYQGSEARLGLHHQERLVPCIHSMRRIARQKPVGVVTGRPTCDAVRFLHRFEVQQLMRVIVCREDYAPVLKPHPRPLQVALARLGITASHRVWYFGDTPEDMHCAVGAGVRGIGVVAPGDDPLLATSALLEAGADYVIQSLADL